MSKVKQKIKVIDPDMPISEIIAKYPEIAEMLVYDYGFHCIGCYIAEYETLREGAIVHGITDMDFDRLVEKINDTINS